MKGAVLAWAAGMIDGEGCIGIYHTRTSGYGFVLSVSVGNTEIELLEALRSSFGGGVYAIRKTQANPGWKRAYQWRPGSRKAASFLDAILPYLQSPRKTEAAVLGLEYQSQKVVGRLPRDVERVHRARQQEYYWEMRRLNLRGSGKSLSNSRRRPPRQRPTAVAIKPR